MPNRYDIGLAIGVGLLLAVAVGLRLPPVVAFGCGAAAILLAAAARQAA